MLEKVSSFFKQTPKKAPQRGPRKPREAIENKTEKIINAPLEAKKLFWGKYPYYPEMGNAYRKLFQSLKIDNNKTIKMHETFCGTDMCNIVSGLGPNVDYCCRDDEVLIIEQNIKKFALEKKTGRVLEKISPEDTKRYFTHIMSLVPVSGNDQEVDWKTLAEKTLSGGYVIIPRKITNDNDAKKPSQKLADNIEFYFYTQVDHTAHWISMIEAKLNLMKTMGPETLSKMEDKQVLKAYGEEATKWAMDLKPLKAGEQKIVSMIYKRDDVAD